MGSLSLQPSYRLFQKAQTQYACFVQRGTQHFWLLLDCSRQDSLPLPRLAGCVCHVKPMARCAARLGKRGHLLLRRRLEFSAAQRCDLCWARAPSRPSNKRFLPDPPDGSAAAICSADALVPRFFCPDKSPMQTPRSCAGVWPRHFFHEVGTFIPLHLSSRVIQIERAYLPHSI